MSCSHIYILSILLCLLMLRSAVSLTKHVGKANHYRLYLIVSYVQRTMSLSRLRALVGASHRTYTTMSGHAPLHLYTAGTPNGKKVSYSLVIRLEPESC